MQSFRNSYQLFFTTRPALWIGVPLSLVVGLGFYAATSSSIEGDSRQRFIGYTANAQNTIKARIKSYSDLLRGSVSLFSTNEVISKRQFHAYVTGLGLAEHYPAVATINFARSFGDQERPAFEARMRADFADGANGGAPFQITPPGRRSEYTVLILIEPSLPWSSTLGLDIEANPLVAPTVMAMRDTGTVVNSGVPIPAITSPNHIGLAQRMPVYRAGMPLRTVAEHRAAHLGSVGIAFWVDRLVKGVLDDMPVKNVRMTLIDEGVGPGDLRRGSVLFDSGVGAAPPAPPANDGDNFRNALLLDFNGRTWRVTFIVPKRSMYSGFEEYIPWLAMGAGFISSMLLYALFHTLSSSRQRAVTMAKAMTRELRDSQAKLQLSHQNLRRLAAHADQIKEGERKRIAREIHDDLGQNLLALRIEVDMLASRTREHHPRLHARARGTLQQIDVTIKSVRQIINDLRPNVLDLGLSAAVEWQIAEFVRRTGIACELVDQHKEITLHDHCATAFFRILQESLSNIVRHAQANAVRVELSLTAGRLSMTVSDNGVGLQAGGRNKVGSFGLVGIEERINILGGVCSISSAPRAGTTVCVTVPLQHDATRGTPGTANLSGAHAALA